MESSCIATVKRLSKLSIQARNMWSLLSRALPKMLGFPPTLLKSFSKEDQQHHPPLMEATCKGILPELPQDIMMDIFTLLEIPDLVRARSVCRSWCSAYTSLHNLGQYKRCQTPCLLYTCETDSESVARLYNLVEKRSYKLSLPAETPIRSRCLNGSSNGWLLTVDYRSEMHLLNPITREQFALPSVITIEQVTPIFDETGAMCKYHYVPSRVHRPMTLDLGELRKYLHRKAFVFYDTCAESYVVVLIHNPSFRLSFAWLGDDKWTSLPPHSDFMDCIYKDGLLYAVAHGGEIFAFNLRGPMVTVKLIMGRATTHHFENTYIVQSPPGDLLLVERKQHIYHEDDDSVTYFSKTENFHIFEVDTAAKKLVKINSLDDHVLVLGDNQSLCLSAEEYPQLKANRVYFTDDLSAYLFGYKNTCHDIGVFDLANNSTEELVSTQLWSDWPAPIWITPALAKISPTLVRRQELCPTVVPSLHSSSNPACLRAAYYICFCIICAYLIGWGTIL